MKNYTVPEREIPLSDEYEVIVVGGGPAGCTAATAAAREGAKTLLLEATGSLGGMGTSGLIPWFCGYGDGEKVISRGLAEKVRLELGKGMPHLRPIIEKGDFVTPAIDPELLKRIYDEMVTDAGATVRFGTSLCGVEKLDDSHVDALLVADKSGLHAYKAKVYVDCTGDADLAAWAGAPFEKGDDQGQLQPATHCFVINNIDEEALADGPRIHFYDPDSPVWKALRDPRYPLIEELHSCSMKIGPGTYGFNTGHLFDVDNTDPESISHALMKGRQMAKQYYDAFAEHLPAFTNSFLTATGSLLGVRETRRIIGDYVLTGDDYRAARDFPDSICRNAYGIDIHCSRKRCLELAQKTIEELKEFNRQVTQKLPAGQSVSVPFRCLIPKTLNNVLTAGRCISTDRMTNGTVRIMACCLNTGEAAGIGAAMAAKDDGNVRAVDATHVRSMLREYGAFL